MRFHNGLFAGFRNPLRHCNVVHASTPMAQPAVNISTSQRHFYRTKKKETETSPSKSTRKSASTLTRTALEDLQTILPGSTNHSCLSTFLTHARRTNLSARSTLYIGTHYEYLVASALQRLGFRLVRVGRANDAGIDLLGEWSVPSHPQPIRVLLQCKKHARKLVPDFVRELEGAFAGAPAGWRGEGTLGFLVSPRSASKGVREALGRSTLPVGFISLEGEVAENGNDNDNDATGFSATEDEAPSENSDDAAATAEANVQGLLTNQGIVKQFLWNWRAQQLGLEGMGVTWRYSQDSGSLDSTTARDIALTWNGWAINRLGETTQPLGNLNFPTTIHTTAKKTKAVLPKKANNPTTSETQEQQHEQVRKKRGRPKKT